MSIHQKSLVDITWADLEQLIDAGVGEGPMLDYKRTLSHPDGEDPWIKGKFEIGRPARNELAREVIAFANAYGGTVLLGVDEGTGNSGLPERLSPLPRAADLAERLHRAISDIVDPPLPGFLAAAILEPTSGGSGVIALRASSSDAAPHGFGSPPAAYVRRGTSSVPMTMRDLQSVFWEARTKRERIDNIRSGFRAELANAFRFGPSELAAPQMTTANGLGRSFATPLGGSQGLFVRITAIAQQSMELGIVNLRSAVPRSRLAATAFSDGWWMPFGGSSPQGEWRPRAHGLQGFDIGPSLWTVLDDGTINLTGFTPGPPHENLQNAHFPGSIVLHAAQTLVMADRLRRQSGRPDIPIEIDIEFRHEGSAKAAEGPGIRPLFAGHINKHVEIGPLIFEAQSNAERVFRELELQIWSGMGFRTSIPADVDFKKWFSEGG